MRQQVADGQGQEDVGAVVVGGDDQAACQVDAGIEQDPPDGGVTVNRHMLLAQRVFAPVDQDERHRRALEEPGGGAADTAVADNKYQVVGCLLPGYPLQVLQLLAAAGQHQHGGVVDAGFGGRNRVAAPFPDADHGQPGFLADAGLFQGQAGKRCAVHRYFGNLQLVEGVEHVGQGATGRRADCQVAAENLVQRNNPGRPGLAHQADMLFIVDKGDDRRLAPAVNGEADGCVFRIAQVGDDIAGVFDPDSVKDPGVGRSTANDPEPFTVQSQGLLLLPGDDDVRDISLLKLAD